MGSKLVGVAITIFGFLFFLLIYRNFIYGTGLMGYIYTIILFLLLSFVSHIANESIQCGRKKSISSLSLEELNSVNNLVLYLRSFKDDTTTSRYSGIDITNVATFRPKSFITDEEMLVKELRCVGRVVCIGRPGEELPEIGAERVYVNNKEWQELIPRLMELSRLVVMRIGGTEGLLWEVEKAINLVKSERLLFLVPSNKNVYDGFRAVMKGRGLLHLPAFDDRLNDKKEVNGLVGLIYFFHDWIACFVPFKKKKYMGVELQKIFNQLRLTAK